MDGSLVLRFRLSGDLAGQWWDCDHGRTLELSAGDSCLLPTKWTDDYASLGCLNHLHRAIKALSNIGSNIWKSLLTPSIFVATKKVIQVPSLGAITSQKVLTESQEALPVKRYLSKGPLDDKGVGVTKVPAPTL